VSRKEQCGEQDTECARFPALPFLLYPGLFLVREGVVAQGPNRPFPQQAPIRRERRDSYWIRAARMARMYRPWSFG